MSELHPERWPIVVSPDPRRLDDEEVTLIARKAAQGIVSTIMCGFREDVRVGVDQDYDGPAELVDIAPLVSNLRHVRELLRAFLSTWRQSGHGHDCPVHGGFPQVCTGVGCHWPAVLEEGNAGDRDAERARLTAPVIVDEKGNCRRCGYPWGEGHDCPMGLG